MFTWLRQQTFKPLPHTTNLQQTSLRTFNVLANTWKLSIMKLWLLGKSWKQCGKRRIWSLYDPSREKTNIVDSSKSIDPAQPKHAAQAYPFRHFSDPVDVLFQESLLYTCIPLRRNLSARISLCGQRRLIWVDTWGRCHIVGFLAGRLIWNDEPFLRVIQWFQKSSVTEESESVCMSESDKSIIFVMQFINSFSAELLKVDSSLLKIGRLHFSCDKSFGLFW